MKTVYNKLVGFKDGDYYFCDYIFEDGEHKGATATVLMPISRNDYEERTDPDNSDVLEQFEENWKEAVRANNTTESLQEFVTRVLAVDGDEAVFDFSGYDLWDSLREAVPSLTEEDYPVFECTGVGRSFSPDMKWDTIYDEELWAKIKAIETN